MKIPKRFKLLGQTIEVEYDKSLYPQEDRHGVAIYRENKIKLQPPNDGSKMPMDAIEHNFCHELAHWILFYSGSHYRSPKDHLHQDEHLVDLLGGLLHQFMETAEYK